MHDFSLFKSKQDKNIYLTKESNLISYNGDESNNLLNISLLLNTISNQIWIKIDKDIKLPKIFSYFHLINPYVRNDSLCIKTNYIKYLNHITKLIEMEFEEINNDDNLIQLTNDENGINIIIHTYKDIYLSVFQKIFEFIFQLEKYFVEYNNVDYSTNERVGLKSNAFYCLYEVLKIHFIPKNETLFNKENQNYKIGKFFEFVDDIKNNIFIEGLICGNLNQDIINNLKKIILKYNKKEYTNNYLFNNMINCKKKLYQNAILDEKTIHIYKLNRNFIEDNINYFLAFYQFLKNENENFELFLILLFLLLRKNLQTYKIFLEKKDNFYYLLLINKGFYYCDYLAKEMNENIINFMEQIKNVQESELFEIIKDIKVDFEKEINLNIHYWNEIYNCSYDFNKINRIRNNFYKYFMNETVNLEIIKNFKSWINEYLLEKQRKLEFILFNCFQKIKPNNNNIYPGNIYDKYNINLFIHKSIDDIIN